MSDKASRMIGMLFPKVILIVVKCIHTYLYLLKYCSFSLEHGDVQTRGLNSAITSAAGKRTTTTRISTPPTTTTATTSTTSTNPTAATDATYAASTTTYTGNLNYSQISIYLYMFVYIF
jgi:hypothetical protein